MQNLSFFLHQILRIVWAPAAFRRPNLESTGPLSGCPKSFVLCTRKSLPFFVTSWLEIWIAIASASWHPNAISTIWCRSRVSYCFCLWKIPNRIAFGPKSRSHLDPKRRLKIWPKRRSTFWAKRRSEIVSKNAGALVSVGAAWARHAVAPGVFYVWYDAEN